MIAGKLADRPHATLDEMQDWARHLIHSRHPDVIIGENYLRRWHVIPRNTVGNVYLHQFLRSDDDRALHDHPSNNSSWLISGCYIEHTHQGKFLRQPGDFVERKARQLHRIELIDNQPCVSLFTTGPKIRDWGFDCPKGWVPWWEFCSPDDPDQIGKGCG